jgi:hypothetical protein
MIVERRSVEKLKLFQLKLKLKFFRKMITVINNKLFLIRETELWEELSSRTFDFSAVQSPPQARQKSSYSFVSAWNATLDHVVTSSKGCGRRPAAVVAER